MDYRRFDLRNDEMGTAGGGYSAHFIGARTYHGDHSGIIETRAHFDEIYGADWREKTLKTLEQELKERGLESKSGDDEYQVVPTPRLIGDRVSLGMICLVIAFVSLCA